MEAKFITTKVSNMYTELNKESNSQIKSTVDEYITKKIYMSVTKDTFFYLGLLFFDIFDSDNTKKSYE